MTSVDTRRTFVGSLLLAGGSVAAFAKSIQQDERGGSPAVGDALFEHIQSQFATLLRTARARGGFISGEDAATAAAFMRVCAIHARGLELDAEARRVLTIRVRDIGRDALVNLAPDLSALRTKMRRKGLPISDRMIDQLGATDPATRAAALQAIQQEQATRVCDALADAFEAIAPTLARGKAQVVRIAARDEGWCNFLVGQWTMFLAIAWYIASFQDPALQGYLEAMWSGFVTYEVLYLQQC
jgi:hypothetical protein